MNSYHNTNALKSSELAEANQKSGYQEDIVLKLFTDSTKNPRVGVSQIYDTLLERKLIDPKVPITSIRRAVSNLVRKKMLTKLNETRQGPLGKPEFLHCLNPRRP